MRIRMADVAVRLKQTPLQVGLACGLSRTAAYNLMAANERPKRLYRGALETRVRAGMRQLGATEAELATLFDEVDVLPHQAGRVRQVRPPEPTSEEPEVLSLKATLTPQAKRHFRLFDNPFDGPVTREEQFFLGAEIAYVREAAFQCAQTASMVAIVGESGAGKTTMLEDLEERLARQPRGIVILKPAVLGMEMNDHQGKTVKSADILHAIVAQLAPETQMPQTVQARTLLARKLLTASAGAGNTHLLVIEEAHSMPDATFRHLKRLHELRDGRRSLLGILLLAQPELKRRLADGLRDGTLREVAQRCELVELLPLDRELKPYLECRAKAVGAELAKIVDDSGIEQIRQRLTRKVDARRTVSLAYPLASHNVITRAMNTAAEIGAPLVTADVVKAI